MTNSLSIIMPALNEELNIKNAVESAIKALQEYNINGEILVINDGSTDKTAEIVEKLIEKNDCVKIIHHENPKGIGASFWAGAKNASKGVVVLFPGDNEVDVEDAMRYFYLMEYVDIIVPFFHNVEIRHRLRRIISSLYRFIINISFGISLNYTNGTVFYKKELLEEVELKNFGFFYQAELLIKLIRKGYFFAEVPCLLSVREGGDSKAITFKSLIQVIKGYLRLAYEIHVKWFENKDKNYFSLNKNSKTYKRKAEFEQKIKFAL